MAFQYIPLHFNTFRYVLYIPFIPDIPLCSTTFHYIPSHSINSTAVLHIALHSTTFRPWHSFPFHFIPLCSATCQFMQFHSITFHYIPSYSSRFCYIAFLCFLCDICLRFLTLLWLDRFILREGEQDMAEDLIEPDSQDGEGNGFHEGIVGKPTSTNSPQLDCSF